FIGQSYVDMALSGVCTDEQRAIFVEAGQKMIEEKDADAIVLAGTDLNLAFDGIDPGYRVVDALDVHVDLLARLAVGEAQLPS
ncbi:MAG: aspartate/glutamate racemase family protein, partial [Pseudomonadota bacterium]